MLMQFEECKLREALKVLDESNLRYDYKYQYSNLMLSIVFDRTTTFQVFITLLLVLNLNHFSTFINY